MLSNLSKQNKTNKTKQNQNKSNQLLVVNKTVPSKKLKVKTLTLGDRNSFLRALVSPFSPDAYGVRVPDPFPFPTVTYHIRQSTVLGTSGGNTSGSLAFFPNPLLSMIDLTRINGGGTTVTDTPMTRYGPTTSQQGFIFGATSLPALSAVYSSQRVVSWGIKISNLQPELSATGRIIIAMVPIGDTVPGINELSLTALNSPGLLTPIFGATTSAIGSSAILQLPSAQQFAVQDLLHGDLEISGMYTNTNFWSFKTMVANGIPTANFGMGDSSVNSNVTGQFAVNDYKDPTRMVGGCAIVIFYEGMPVNTANAFQLETVYHLEGSPQLSSSSNTSPVPSGAEKTEVGTIDVVDRAMGVASRLENVFTFITKGADFLNRNSPQIISATGKVLNAGRALASMV